MSILTRSASPMTSGISLPDDIAPGEDTGIVALLIGLGVLGLRSPLGSLRRPEVEEDAWGDRCLVGSRSLCFSCSSRPDDDDEGCGCRLLL